MEILENLLTKNYCERLEGQRNVFRYIAWCYVDLYTFEVLKHNQIKLKPFFFSFFLYEILRVEVPILLFMWLKCHLDDRFNVEIFLNEVNRVFLESFYPTHCSTILKLLLAFRRCISFDPRSGNSISTVFLMGSNLVFWGLYKRWNCWLDFSYYRNLWNKRSWSFWALRKIFCWLRFGEQRDLKYRLYVLWMRLWRLVLLHWFLKDRYL